MPTESESGMPREAKRRKSNDGKSIEICHSFTPQRSSVSDPRFKPAPAASSPLTELQSSQLPPTPEPNVDYQAVLLSLSDEYVSAAYSLTGSLAAADSTREQYEQYHDS